MMMRMGKYDTLHDHLRRRQLSPWKVSFNDIAALVPGGLPASAFSHATWWSNSDSHVEASAWLEAGWRTERVDLGRRSVTFVRAE